MVTIIRLLGLLCTIAKCVWLWLTVDVDGWQVLDLID